MDANYDGEVAAETLKEKTVVCEFEDKQLPNDRVQGLRNQDPCPKWLMHTSVVDSAILFWRQGLPWTDMLFCVDYNMPLIIGTQHQGITNVMTNIGRLGVDEIDRGPQGNGRRAMIWREQRCTEFIVDLISKLS